MSNDPSNQNAYVRYTPLPNAQVQFLSSSGSKWAPPTLNYNDSRTFTFTPYSPSSEFTFQSITFWPKGTNNKIVNNVARTFWSGGGGSPDAAYDGFAYIQNVSVQPGSISFLISNNGPSKNKGYIAFEVTIQDASTGENYSGNLYTSVDPEVPLEKQQ